MSAHLRNERRIGGDGAPHLFGHILQAVPNRRLYPLERAGASSARCSFGRW